MSMEQKQMEAVVRSLGVPGHRLRFRIFLRAVELAAEDGSRLDCRGRGLYALLSEEFHRPKSRISKNIGSYCAALWSFGDLDRLNELARRCVEERPEPLELVGIVSGYLNRQKSRTT